eukprot:1161571-Rhodomonas_salina.1
MHSAVLTLATVSAGYESATPSRSKAPVARHGDDMSQGRGLNGMDWREEEERRGMMASAGREGERRPRSYGEAEAGHRGRGDWGGRGGEREGGADEMERGAGRTDEW